MPAASPASGVNCSFTRKSTSRVVTSRSPLEMWNEFRNPNWSARTPPTRSPAISPEKIELDSSPRANPCFSRGVLHATRVVDAAIVPVKHP